MSIFTQVQHEKVRKNVFDLTHDKKLSTEFGRLTPCFVMDVVPGDKVSIKPSALVRFAPMVAPIMHQANVYMHYFFVPNRILWDNWENFITGGEDGLDQSVWPHMNINLKGAQYGSLHDYLGLPVNDDVLEEIASSTFEVSVLPYAAYQTIYNEYFRDENLIEKLDLTVVDGPNAGGNFTQLRNRAWQHDYFTSALPWTQKGPEALLPLGQEAPIVAKDPLDPDNSEQYTIFRQATDGTAFNLADKIHAGGDVTNQDAMAVERGDGSGTYIDGYVDLNDTHYTDLTSATAASISDLRRAVKLQEWLEKNARGGSRYTESIQVHFGVKPLDARLNRPEYIGGSASPCVVETIYQTSTSGIDSGGNNIVQTPQGNMAGAATSVGSGGWISKYCEEHGYIIGIMSVMPKSAYQQGIHKHWFRRDKFDYYWPEFAHIGEQPIFNKEIALTGDFLKDDDVFGYTPRYSEYKYMCNSVHGDFRGSLAFWHMGRKFATPPSLNEDFITMDAAEVNRVFSVYEGADGEELDHLWCQVLNQVKASRPMPVFGNPKFV